MLWGIQPLEMFCVSGPRSCRCCLVKSSTQKKEIIIIIIIYHLKLKLYCEEQFNSLYGWFQKCVESLRQFEQRLA